MTTSTERTLMRLAILTTTVTIALILVGVWWWALLGMTSEVGGATMLTTGVFAMGSAVLWGVWVNTRGSNR